jgi:hypothetical protein
MLSSEESKSQERREDVDEEEVTRSESMSERTCPATSPRRLLSAQWLFEPLALYRRSC